ncbi:MAG: hypothetical protein IT176_02665 [Acidobacteria bacterium]|nr:hypothetical protein [Acidobacteriota bacterium]
MTRRVRLAFAIGALVLVTVAGGAVAKAVGEARHLGDSDREGSTVELAGAVDQVVGTIAADALPAAAPVATFSAPARPAAPPTRTGEAAERNGEAPQQVHEEAGKVAT